jgi:uncharacterized membrane protein
MLSPTIARAGVRGEAPIVRLAKRYPPGGTSLLVPLFVLAAWLLLLPSLLGYSGHPLAWSDRISGGAILVVALVGAIRLRPWIIWIAGAIGLWLILAPVALWAPSLGAYIAGTLTGILVAFEGAVLPLSWITHGDDVPKGWSYNPSAWSQRIPVILLAAASLVIAGYLTAFQLGAIGSVWDPLFGDGTRRVLESDVSRAWPVSDAGLGAAMFAIDLLMTCAGDRRRWRTMPWLVLLFGVMIIPVGIVSIVLVMLQPVAVGAWCFWCLITAVTTLAMIPLALDEVAASLQLLRETSRRGESWWRVMWRGADEGAAPAAPARSGPHVPWSLVVMALAGAWLMLEPSLFAMSPAQADSGHITGALVIVVAVVAMSELGRPLRFAAIPLALWTAASPWLLVEAQPATRMTALAVAAVIAIATYPRGAIAQRHGPADRLALWPSNR